MIDDLKWAAPDRYELLKDFAKKNRANPTQAEQILWQHIRGKVLGTKFFRQFVIADYIADFASVQHQLVIEVDGAYHSELNQIICDEDCTQRLQDLGFTVIRFTNEDIYDNIESVINIIKQHLHNE